MLRITTQQNPGKLTLTVEGKISGPWVTALEQSWQELRSSAKGEQLSVNLCGVSFIDAAGKALLKQIHHQGGKLVAVGCLNQAIVREIAADEKNGKSDDTKSSKRTPIIFYILFLGISLATAASLRAQTSDRHNALPPNPPTEVLKLTLDQAVALALKQNTTAITAVIQAAEAVQDKNVARAALLPQANLESAESIRRLNIEAQFGSRIPGFAEHVGPYQVFQAGSAFSAPVFDLTLWRRYQGQRSLANAAKASSLSTREQVILLVVSQYIGTLRDVATVQAADSRVNLAQALYDQAADLQKEGVGTGIDTLRANVELQNEKQRLIEAQASRETSLYGLSRLLNLDPRQAVELADSLSYFETPQPDVEQSIEQALAERQEWKSLNDQIRAAEWQKKQAWDQRLPSLTAEGEWDYQGTRLNNGIPAYNYELALNLPLFTGGRIRAESTRADLEIRRLQQQQDDLRNQLGLDVKTALINLTSARSEVQVANLGVQLSQQEVDQARDRFRAGVANNIEVIQAQDSLARANDNQIAALYRFNQARADLARAVGQMERVYAK
jgi:outer membrane protein TolC/anti-anti-sigma regulatory factor